MENALLMLSASEQDALVKYAHQRMFSQSAFTCQSMNATSTANASALGAHACGQIQQSIRSALLAYDECIAGL
jgi:hypothetical protein